MTKRCATEADYPGLFGPGLNLEPDPEMAPVGSTGVEGNTISSTPTRPAKKAKKRVSANKRWIFVWNNYPSDYKTYLALLAPNIHGMIYGREVGESGTPHLQGYLEFREKMRPSETKGLPKQMHWEPAKKSRLENIIYCSKDGDWEASRPSYRRPRRPRIISDLRPWQQEIVNIVKTLPDERTIHWYWEPNGGIGKTSMNRYLCDNWDALVCSGKAADMKYAIAQMEVKPSLIIFDVPRCNMGYISYTGIEEIKNACFFSSKYESGQVLFDFPHVFVFANEPPDYDKMSMDRWHVVDIREVEAAEDRGSAPQPSAALRTGLEWIG